MPNQNTAGPPLLALAQVLCLRELEFDLPEDMLAMSLLPLTFLGLAGQDVSHLLCTVSNNDRPDVHMAGNVCVPPGPAHVVLGCGLTAPYPLARNVVPPAALNFPEGPLAPNPAVHASDDAAKLRATELRLPSLTKNLSPVLPGNARHCYRDDDPGDAKAYNRLGEIRPMVFGKATPVKEPEAFIASIFFAYFDLEVGSGHVEVADIHLAAEKASHRAERFLYTALRLLREGSPKLHRPPDLAPR